MEGYWSGCVNKESVGGVAGSGRTVCDNAEVVWGDRRESLLCGLGWMCEKLVIRSEVGCFAWARCHVGGWVCVVL